MESLMPSMTPPAINKWWIKKKLTYAIDRVDHLGFVFRAGDPERVFVKASHKDCDY